jgi:hypothetical protein
MCGKIQDNLKTGSRETWLKSYKITSLPALLIGNKNWSVIKKQERRTETAEVNQSCFYPPTDAQLNCLKNNFKIDIKIDIKTAPTCFGAITIIRERIIRAC